MERDINDLNASTETDRDRSTAGNPGGTSNTGGAGSYGAGASSGNSGGTANLGGTTGLGGSANTGSGSAGYGTGGAGNTNYGGASYGSTNYGSTGATESAAGAGLGLGGASEGESRTDRLRSAAQDRAGQAREKLGEAGTKARDLKTKVEQGLADRLEAGASRLRERGGASGSGMTPAYANGGAAASSDDAASAQAKAAKGMEATADWLRNGDLKGTIETQARTNPGRTLLVALGVGYLLGKTIRR